MPKLLRAKSPVEPVGGYVVAYCDGSCGAGDRIGGWGYVVHDALDMHEHWGTVTDTTSAVMELQAAIEALGAMIDLKFHRRPVLVCTDSQYVTNGSMKEREWRNNSAVKNRDHWQTIWAMMDHFDHVSFAWVRGHAGHYWNEYVDRLAEHGRRRGIEERDNRRREGYGRQTDNHRSIERGGSRERLR